MTRAVPYRRVSAEEQALSGHGLNAQEDTIRAFATRMGWEITEFFTDAGLSGSLPIDKRPALFDAVARLKKGDVLLVAKRDRLGRLDNLEMGLIELAVKKRGARIISCAGEGTENDDPASVAMRGMVDIFSNYTRLIIKANTKSALRSKRIRGEKTGGSVPYGFMLGEGRLGPHGKIVKTLVPCPAEQEVIALMRELRAQGMTLVAIAEELTSRGIKRRGGSAWEFSFIAKTLKKSAA
jgi:site-specific DNA recombinase